MKSRTDLTAPTSPPGIEVIQLTTDDTAASSHVYMEAQIFTPDSKRFLLHESAHAHGSDPRDPRHRYMVCDLEDGCALSPLAGELGVTAPSVSPDGRFVYYFVNETEPNGGRLTLKRVNLDGTDRRTLLVLDAALPGTPFRPSRIYPLSTIRSDGKRLALSCFLGDGTPAAATSGLMVFDLEQASVRLILEGPTWCNIHPQYSRSEAEGERRDILIQENHGCVQDVNGEVRHLTGGAGADIHVIRDDGTGFRNLPWGRDDNEFCQGHQCWRGRSSWAVTSTVTRRPPENQLIESQPVAHAGHIGIATPGGTRNPLSRSFEGPCFFHFATDRDGQSLITDAGPMDGGGRLFLARLERPGQDAAMSWTFLLSPRCSWKKEAHIHPFLSPDGSMGFFNSDESGRLQAYMIRGLSGLV
jgi:hypothetical protein